MERVYCGKFINEKLEPNCNHFVILTQNGEQFFQCHEPANLQGNPIAKGLPNLAPHEKNVNCDCPDFELAIGPVKTMEIDTPTPSTSPGVMPSGGKGWNLEK